MNGPGFKATLRELGISQRQLAITLGLAVSTVSHWATGTAPVPQYAIAYLDLLRERAEIAAKLSVR